MSVAVSVSAGVTVGISVEAGLPVTVDVCVVVLVTVVSRETNPTSDVKVSGITEGWDELPLQAQATVIITIPIPTRDTLPIITYPLLEIGLNSLDHEAIVLLTSVFHTLC